MSITGITNIPLLLEMSNNNVRGATLYGVLIPDVVTPPHLEAVQPTRKGVDLPVIIDLVGIETSGVRGYAKGQVFTLAPKSIVEHARKKKSGRLGVVLTGGSLKLDTRFDDDFVSYLRWVKYNNIWKIESTSIIPLRATEHPEFHDLLLKGYSQNWDYPYPCKIDASYRPASQGVEFQFLDGSYFDKSKSLSPEKQLVTIKETANSEKLSQVVQPQVLWSSKTPEVPQITQDYLKTAGKNPLGVSTSSDVADISRNLVATQTLTKEKVQGRDKFTRPSKNFSIMQKSVEEASKKVDKVIKYLEEESLDDIDTDTIELEDGEELTITVGGTLRENASYTVNQLHKYWKRTAGEYTGRALFKEACGLVLDEKFTSQGVDGNSILDTALDLHGSSILSFLTVSSDVPRARRMEGKKYDGFYLELESKTFQIYYQMLDILLGTGNKLRRLFKEVSEKLDISIPRIMYKNPYMLCFSDPRFTVEDLDKIAMFAGVDLTDREIIRTRNVSYMHNFMLDSSNRVIRDNTIVRLSDLRRGVRAGFILSSPSYNVLQTDGTVIKSSRIESLRVYFKEDIEPKQFALSTKNWDKRGNRFYQEIRGVDTDSMINDFVKSGLGVRMTLNGIEYVADYVFAEKECYIYNRLYQLSLNKVKEIPDKDIEKCIQSFEKIKTEELNLSEPFKLEQRQADAVRLVRNPVMCLTGPAGSGKTTTAEALVFAAETLLGFDETEIMFCAPTGKASNRLKEVVKRKTRTIHSLFGVGGDSLTLKSADSIRKRDDIRLLVVDEMSMPNINLLYELMLRIDDGTHIYFLGDIEQLPPIGFGKPFANLLQFLPTVVLNVSKRASDTSGITYNAKKIIYESDGYVEDLEDKSDFRILNTQSIDEGVRHVLDIVEYHLGRSKEPRGFKPIETSGINLNPDDIQVISPLNKYKWGTKELNRQLQDIFNPLKPRETYLSYARGKDDITQFRKGDRVIHTKTNQPRRSRFILNEDGTLTEIEEKGINNGEQGKILRFYKPSELVFTTIDGDENKDLKALFGGNAESVVYIAVQYSDTDEFTGDSYDFIILYRANIIFDAGYQLNVNSPDLDNLELAYALTTHKLQGSEAKLVIIIMFQVGRGDFISRNMIYTAITRGKQGVYFVGDIKGPSSAVNRGRRVEQSSQRLSMLDLF